MNSESGTAFTVRSPKSDSSTRQLRGERRRPLRVVFDNPRTVVLRHDEGRPVWNPVLAPVAIDYGFTIELCTPRQPQQKGAVENLVGYVKRAFFRARRFSDVATDLPEQLSERHRDKKRADQLEPGRRVTCYGCLY